MAKKKYDRDPETGKRFHSYVPEMADDLRTGKVSRREFLRTSTLLGVSAGAAYAMASDILGEDITPKPTAASAQTPKQGGVLNSGMRVQRMDDPAIYDWVERSNQTRGIAEFMTRTGVDNITRPYLAKSWEANEALDEWTFKLQEGVKWSNGDDFNADDMIFNVTRWLDPDVGSSNAGLFSSLSEEVERTVDGEKKMVKVLREGAVEKVDDYTVKLNLSRADLAIPESFYNYPTAIVHRRFDEEGGDFAANPVGTGPYTLEELRVGEVCKVRRRTDPHGYWGRDPYLDGITYRDYGDEPQALVSAFASGEIDHLYEVAINSLDLVKRIPDAEIKDVSTARTGIGRFRVSEKPFDNKKLRQAFVTALDHEEILRLAYRGFGLVGENHHVWPLHPEYFQLPALKRDVEKAKALLAESGLGPTINISMDLSASEDWHKNAAQAMKNQLAPVGIILDVNVMPGATYWDVWDTTPLGFTQWTHRPLGVMVLNLAYRGGVPWNESNYNNPDFDKELDKAGGILDVDERRKQMKVVQGILQDDAVFAQPVWASGFSLIRKGKVQGHATHPTLYHQFQDWWLA